MDLLPMSLLGFGFLSGIRHAFDIDHVAAVSTIASKSSPLKKSSLLGVFWGFGHTISLLFAGLIVLFLKITIPQKIASFFEFIVAIMLIALGINVLLAIKKERMHIHKHSHGRIEHIHFHSHKTTYHHKHSHAQLKKSMLIGLIHGLAGSAALTLLVLARFNSTMLGLIYILLFGTGSILGMAIISAIISLPFKLIPSKLQSTQRLLGIGTGVISIVAGLAVLI